MATNNRELTTIGEDSHKIIFVGRVNLSDSRLPTIDSYYTRSICNG